MRETEHAKFGSEMSETSSTFPICCSMSSSILRKLSAETRAVVASVMQIVSLV